MSSWASPRTVGMLPSAASTQRSVDKVREALLVHIEQYALAEDVDYWRYVTLCRLHQAVISTRQKKLIQVYGLALAWVARTPGYPRDTYYAVLFRIAARYRLRHKLP